jgi:hypothetical protein
MSRKQLKTNTYAISTLAIALIIIIVVGSIAAVVVAVVFFGFWKPAVQGSGNLATEEKSFTDFTSVAVGWGFEVEISQSDSYSISITADDNLFDYMEISKTGNTLTIGMKQVAIGTLEARITMPDLYELDFSGGTQGNVEGSTSSHDFVLSLSGGSTISLEGAANDLTISGSGGSHLSLSDFPVHDTTVNLSGGSDATINLDGRLVGDLSGGSHLKYVGTPTAVVVNTSGGSTVGPQ